MFSAPVGSPFLDHGKQVTGSHRPVLKHGLRSLVHLQIDLDAAATVEAKAMADMPTSAA